MLCILLLHARPGPPSVVPEEAVIVGRARGEADHAERIGECAGKVKRMCLGVGGGELRTTSTEPKQAAASLTANRSELFRRRMALGIRGSTAFEISGSARTQTATCL
jgi:hypothetical protein